jgi:hypothetical protein
VKYGATARADKLAFGKQDCSPFVILEALSAAINFTFDIGSVSCASRRKLAGSEGPFGVAKAQ